MSYLRGRFYVFGDGEKINILIRDQQDDITEYANDCEFVAGVAIPNNIFDMLALSHIERLRDRGALADAKRRYTEFHRTGVIEGTPTI